MLKINKTNAARMLDRAAIPYSLIPYPVDEEHLSATHVAAALGQPVGQVFKTLVVRGDRTGILVCIIPADKELNLKAAAQCSQNKKIEMVTVKELLPLTGYIRGGCSPVGMKKNYPAWIDRTCLDYESIYVSAGVRGLQIKINPKDLIRFTGATPEDLSEP